MKEQVQLLPLLGPHALSPIAGEETFKIDDRALHGWLGVDSRFHVWIKRRVEEYSFEEGADFRPNVVKTGGRPRKEYHMTLDMAKELAMVERTDIGRETRGVLPPKVSGVREGHMPVVS